MTREVGGIRQQCKKSVLDDKGDKPLKGDKFRYKHQIQTYLKKIPNFEKIIHNMEKLINLHIEKLPEGYYLATSDTIQGLVAQGRTLAETLEIARDIAKKLLEAREEQDIQLITPSDKFEYPIVVGL